MTTIANAYNDVYDVDMQQEQQAQSKDSANVNETCLDSDGDGDDGRSAPADLLGMNSCSDMMTSHNNCRRVSADPAFMNSDLYPEGEHQFFQRYTSSQIMYTVKKKTPKLVGRFIMGDMVGEGSYGKVKEAMDSFTLQRVAVKIMKKKKLRKIPGGEANVKQEIMLLKKLRHRNIIELIEVMYNEQKQKMYVVMELCVGVLQEILDSVKCKHLPIFQAHDYFWQLCEGLEYLHSQGIIHRDVKPGNLLLKRDGTLKICDLGVAEMLNRYCEMDTCTSSSGSPAFQPPEIANGCEEFPGPKVDVWAAGVTLFNITTGLYPFEGDNIYNLFESIGKGIFSIPDKVSHELRSLLTGMLCVDPHERLSIARIKKHPWVLMQHPINDIPVPIPPSGDGDSLKGTSLIPFLENMFCCSEPTSLSDFDESAPCEASMPPHVMQYRPVSLSSLSLHMRQQATVANNGGQSDMARQSSTAALVADRRTSMSAARERTSSLSPSITRKQSTSTRTSFSSLHQSTTSGTGISNVIQNTRLSMSPRGSVAFQSRASIGGVKGDASEQSRSSLGGVKGDASEQSRSSLGGVKGDASEQSRSSLGGVKGDASEQSRSSLGGVKGDASEQSRSSLGGVKGDASEQTRSSLGGVKGDASEQTRSSLGGVKMDASEANTNASLTAGSGVSEPLLVHKDSSPNVILASSSFGSVSVVPPVSPKNMKLAEQKCETAGTSVLSIKEEVKSEPIKRGSSKTCRQQ